MGAQGALNAFKLIHEEMINFWTLKTFTKEFGNKFSKNKFN